jgi:hypothetical protein
MPSIVNATTTAGVAVSGDNSGALALQTNNGTTAVTISTSQQVGIGTASPAAPLDVVSDSGSSAISVRGRSADNLSAIRIYSNSGATQYGVIRGAADELRVNATEAIPLTFYTNNSERMRIDSSGNVAIGSTTASEKFNVVTSSGSVYTNITNGTGQVYVGVLGSNLGYFGTVSNHAQTFYTNNTERMRITSGGDLCVGLTSAPMGTTAGSISNNVAVANNTFWTRNSSATPYGMEVQYSGAAPNNTGSAYLECFDTGATRFVMRSNGGLANYSANNANLSDAREKENIELAGNYLDKICAIPVKTFNYIDQNREEDDGLTLGVIAQEVQAVAPELVSESNWAAKDEPEKMRLSIYQTDLQYALMKAIQELKAELDATKAEVQALKGVA